MNRIASYCVVALVAVFSFSSAGCLVVTAAAVTAATILPEQGLPSKLDDVGNMNFEEGIVFGSIQVATDPNARLVGRSQGPIFARVDGEGRAVYSLIMFKLDRRGVPIRDRRWEADCATNQICRFVAKLTEGDYVANTVRIGWRDNDVNLLQFGQIITRVDYRFTVAPREVKYLGRVSVSAPAYDANDEPELPLAIMDESEADSAAVGLSQGEVFVTALLEGDYKSRPIASSLATR